MANSGEKFQQGILEETIVKTLLVCFDKQEEKIDARFQAFLQKFRQTLSQFREELMTKIKISKPINSETTLTSCDLQRTMKIFKLLHLPNLKFVGLPLLHRLTNSTQFGSYNQAESSKPAFEPFCHPQHYTQFTDCHPTPNRTQNSFTPTQRNYNPCEYEPQGFQNMPQRNRCSEFSDFRTKNDIPTYSRQINIFQFLDLVKAIDNFFEYMSIWRYQKTNK